MIDKKFWLKVAEYWRKDIDDNVPPEIDPIPDIPLEDLIPFNSISDDEIDDILADLDLDI